FGGLGPGIATTLLAAGTALYFSLRPPSFITLGRGGAITLPAFVAIGVVISWLFESARRSEAAYRDAALTAGQRARELEAIFEAMPDGVYVGTPERIPRVKAGGVGVLGVRSVEDLSGSSHERGEKFGIRSAATGERLEGERLPF